jgi:hypothetical protein
VQVAALPAERPITRTSTPFLARSFNAPSISTSTLRAPAWASPPASAARTEDVQLKTVRMDPVGYGERPMTDRRELRRLVLRLERNLTVRAHLKTLLSAADTAIALLRRDLHTVKERVAHRARGKEITAPRRTVCCCEQAHVRSPRKVPTLRTTRRIA